MTDRFGTAPEIVHDDNVIASKRYGQLLMAAVEAGIEHMPAAPTIISENPMTFAPAVEIPEDKPPLPATLKPAQNFCEDRRDFANGLRMRAHAPRPRPRRNRFELLDLAEGCCKWPVNDGAPFLFCGDDAPSVYCSHHEGLARTAYTRRRG